MEPNFMPLGSDAIALYAQRQGLAYKPRPSETWFRAWEPFDTITTPHAYFNAVTWHLPPGSATLAEPWTEDGLFEPMDRTLLAFFTHPGFTRRAALRVGESFITRVTFLTDAPPPIVKLGDPVWDEHVVTRAKSPDEARAAFPGPLRQLLQTSGFRGHLEVRPGGLILHCADLKPLPQHYADLGQRLLRVVDAALR
ncbi:MAG: hypothetical protein R3B72_25425 [Polyangiaceae bacterium]